MAILEWRKAKPVPGASPAKRFDRSGNLARSSFADDGEDFDATDRMYIVTADDSLSSIARKFYGTAEARRRIYEANRSLIRDPYILQPGWRLRIPA
jgi:nucleoid-associated protein YgaU